MQSMAKSAVDRRKDPLNEQNMPHIVPLLARALHQQGYAAIARCE
jgi:hypothetical protein